MRLVAEGKVDLDAPVRRYVPELKLADEQTAVEVTVLNLLNHTAGLDWRIITDTGDGDDALAGQVAKMAELKLIVSPGTRASYSQEGFNLAGRIAEKVTGLTYERAVASLLFEPLGLSNTTYSVNDVMTRRFAVGHNPGEGETLSIARQWKDTRGNDPGGGIASSVADQLRWARFHLGDGRAESGARVLPAEVLHRMTEPTVKLRGTTLGDAIGLGWFLRDVDDVRTVGHGGSGNGPSGRLVRPYMKLIQSCRVLAVVISLRLNNLRPFGHGIPGLRCALSFRLRRRVADWRPRLAGVDGGLLLAREDPVDGLNVGRQFLPPFQRALGPRSQHESARNAMLSRRGAAGPTRIRSWKTCQRRSPSQAIVVESMRRRRDEKSRRYRSGPLTRSRASVRATAVPRVIASRRSPRPPRPAARSPSGSGAAKANRSSHCRAVAPRSRGSPLR